MAKEKGKAFEAKVSQLLTKLVNNHPEAVEVKEQLRIMLHDGQIVIPDFMLRVRLLFEIRQYLIECQHRARSKPDIAQKIRYIRSLSPNNTFIFLYAERIPDTTQNALNADGVLSMSFDDFKDYISRIDIQLNANNTFLMGAKNGLLDDSNVVVRVRGDSSENDIPVVTIGEPWVVYEDYFKGVKIDPKFSGKKISVADLLKNIRTDRGPTGGSGFSGGGGPGRIE